MKTITYLAICRPLILAILFLFSTAMLIAQIKINERVDIAPKSATFNSTEGEYLTSFTLGYTAEVRPSSTTFETSYIDPITGESVYGPCCPISCNGRCVVGSDAECGQGTYGVFSAGTVLTFSVFPPYNNKQYYIGKSDYFSYPDNCGGDLRIFDSYQSDDGVLYFDPPGSTSVGSIVNISRVEFCPPLSITFDITWSVNLMYSDFISLVSGC